MNVKPKRVTTTGINAVIRRLVITICLVALMSGHASAGELSVPVTLSRRAVSVEQTGDLAVVRVHDKDYTRAGVNGRTGLPCRIVNVLLPRGEAVAGYDIVRSPAIRIASNIQLTESPPLVTSTGKQGREPQHTGFSPGEKSRPVVYLGSGILHGFAVASFAVYPVQYRDGSVYIHEETVLKIRTEPSASDTYITHMRRDRPLLDKRTRQTVAASVENPAQLDSYRFDRVVVSRDRGGFQPTGLPSLEGSPVDMVIITSDALAAEFQRLADWKTAKGLPTVVRTTEWIEANYRHGVDLAETIRFFIRDAYENWGVQFVLLGGDTGVIPARYLRSDYLGALGTWVAADMYYACLDGSWNENHNNTWGETGAGRDDPDLYAEVWLGRLPARNLAEAGVLVDKTIAYASPVDLEYTDKVILTGEVLFPIGWKSGDPIWADGGDSAEYLYNIVFADEPLRTVRAYEVPERNPGSVQLSRQIAIDSLNAGYNHFVHVGHGSRFGFSCGAGTFVIGDAESLINGDRLSVVYLVDCKVSAFDYNCINESLMRNPDGGAVATIGYSHDEFPALDSYYMNDFYDLVIEHDIVRIGEAFERARLSRTAYAELGDNADLWTHYVYTLLSDPELMMWTDAVETTVVTHASAMELGSAGITVNVSAGGSPVDSAKVCLSKDNDDYEVGFTDASGDVTLGFTAESPGSVSVVATGINITRSQTWITVNPSAGAYVSYAGSTVDDDSSGASFGNGDGVIDAGETIDLVLSLANPGGAATGVVTFRMSCGNPLVMIPDSTALVGTIGAGSTKAAGDVVTVFFDPAITDETAVEFVLTIEEDGVPAWTDRFAAIVHAPEIELTALSLDDGAPYGNGNGQNESGEQFLLYYGLKNFGTGTASGLTAVLSDLDGGFVFYDSTDAYDDLLPLVAGANLSGFHIEETDAAAPNELEVTIEDIFGRVYRDTVVLGVLLPPSTVSIGSALGVDYIEVVWPHSPSPGVEKYRIYRSSVSGGPYTLASVDAVDHTVFLDSGLSSSTRYYYTVTAIDGYGNESSCSAELSVSTNAPLMSGWPNEMAGSTPSSPAVGDIDGDGDLEIVVGNTLIYAWHHDGTEICDGDNFAQTWGVLSEEGDGFAAAVTLARLDDTPGLEIIAADLGTNRVYCLDYNGDLLPGWPQEAENDFRAAPVAGDLDGDGYYEVIAVDSHGVIYAWTADGQEFRDGDGNPSTPGVLYRTPTTSFHFVTPTLVDIDQDSRDEIVLGSRTDSVYVLNGDGTPVPGFPVELNAEIAGSVVAGDIDGDGMVELLAQTKGEWGGTYVLNHDGTIASGWPITISLQDIYFTPSPALADFDHNGTLEAVVCGWDKLDLRIYVLDYQGNTLPGFPIVASGDYTESSPVVADINGDNSLDIILGGESGLIHAFDISGNEIDGFPVLVNDAVRATPFVVDLDLDGDAELVASSWNRNVYVWDLDGTYNENQAPWPTFQSNVHRNGCIGFKVPTGIGGTPGPARPSGPALVQNYPNPFNPATTIDFHVPDGPAHRVSLAIYDVRGALVRTAVDDVLPPGDHQFVWDGRDNSGNRVGTGVYFYRLEQRGFAATRKMLLLK